MNKDSQTLIFSRDTYVPVLLVAHQAQLSPVLWMQTGTARRKGHKPVHQIDLNEAERSSLLAFHAVTGSDSTSQFAGIGKQTAWKEFVKHHQLLQNIGNEDFPDQQVLTDAESFICKLYDYNTRQPTSQSIKCDVLSFTA